MEDYHKKGFKAVIISIISNIFLAIIKLIAGILGNSFALIADAIESAADVLTSIALYIGIKISIKPPDKDHPYGHGKAEPLSALFVSLSLVLSATFIIIQSIENISTPHELPKPFTLIVLTGIIIGKEVLFRYLQRTANEIDSGAVKSEAWHHRSDALTSAAAFLGIGIALFLGKGYESADDWAALLAAGIIIYNAFIISRSSLAEIMDTAPSDKLINEVSKIALSVNGVIELEKGFVRKMGLVYFIDLHVVVNGELTVRKGHEIAHKVKDKIMESNTKIKDVLIHIEPNRI